MLRGLFFIGLLAFGAAEQASFRNYKVFKVTPANEEQLNLIKQLELNFEDYEYWREPTAVSQPAELMVAPNRLAQFTEFLESHGIKHELSISDVQSLIDQQHSTSNFGSNSSFGWDRYHTLEEIYSWLDGLAEKYPGKAEVVVGGSTYEARKIKGIKIDFGNSNSSVVIDGGIHAREWIAPATVTYLINALLSSEEPEVRALAEAHQWYLFPVVNPDGYVYSHEKNRLWRKTVSEGFLWCKGVDANRNWDFKWMTGGASKIPCMPTYAGRKPFSEIETRSYSNYMKSIGKGLFAYISFHSYSQLLLFPYGHTKEHLENYDELKAIAKKSVEALAQKYGTEYRYGNIAETIYVATGSSVDWAKGVLKVPIAYTYELRGRLPTPGFLLPPQQIIPNSEEVLDSLVAMFKEAKKFGYPKSQQ